MRKINMLLTAALLCFFAATAQAQVTIYGNVINGVNDNWTTNDMGIYKIAISKSGKVSFEEMVTNRLLDPDRPFASYAHLIAGTCGAVYRDGVYYTFHQSETSENDGDYGNADNNVFVAIKIRKWDAASFLEDPDNPASWKQIGETVEVKANSGMAFTDLTYDYNDDMVYAVQVIVSDDSPAVPYQLCTVDLDNLTATPVSTIMLDEEIRSLAAHPNGNLYGLGVSGTLYQIDKETAKMTKVAQLHKNQHRMQSAVIDWRTGKMYWSVNEFERISSENGVSPTREQVENNSKTAFYEVDVEKGTEKLLYRYPMKETVVGLWVDGDFERLDYDLNIKMKSAPRQMVKGQPASFVATVKNLGEKTASTYTVELYVNGQMVKSQKAASLTKGASKDITLTYTPDRETGDKATVQLKLVYSKDENMANNETKATEIVVLQPVLPTVTISAVEANENANITWGKPSNELYTEDFERYAPFIISDMGDWTLVDRDGATLPTVHSYNGEYTWPNGTTPQAYIVFNPWEAGFNADYITEPTSTYYCQSGQQMLCANIGAVKTGDTNDDFDLVPGDNWLISPELSGEEQTIDFYAKSWTSQYEDNYGVTYSSEETFNVLYSLTDTDPASFIMVEDGDDLMAPPYFSDGHFYFDLPEGAKYFAIQHTSEWIPDEYGEYTRMTAFYLDDISYMPNVPGVLGYNIYRNGTKLNAEPVQSLRFSAQLQKGHNELYVTVVYEDGESAPSNTVVIEHDGPVATAIDGLHIDASAMSVYTAAGQYVGNRLPADKGTYVVRQNGKAHKVVVK